MPIFRGWKEPPSVISLCLIALLASCYLAPFTDLDFTWQIRTGEQIVQTGQLRTVDEFSYTIAGQRVHDFEWLYEVGLYLVWSALGVGGLKLLKVVLVATPLLLVGLHLRRQQIPAHAIILILLTAILILVPVWNLRALYCTTIGLLLVTSWLHDHCTGKRPLSWGLPFVMVLWANLHPGVIAGQGLLFGAILWEWANRWLRWNRPLDLALLWRLTLIGGLGLLATFLSPDPFERLLYPFRPELRHPIMRVFVEMQPLVSFVTIAPLPVLVTFLIAAMTTVTVACRIREFRGWEIALLLVLGTLANFAVRSLQDWLLVMLTLAAPHWKSFLEEGKAKGSYQILLEGGDYFQRVFATQWFRFQPGWLMLALAILVGVSFLRPTSAEVPTAEICSCPVKAVDFIESRGLQGKFFAPPNYGSYLGWRLGSQVQVYVDTRGFFFPPQILEDSHILPQMGRDWQTRLQRVLDHFPTEYLLLETTGPRGKLWQYLKANQVKPLYIDEQTVLLPVSQVRQILQTEVTLGKIPVE